MGGLRKVRNGRQKDEIKKWYDGFVFGEHRDIYNPWSITNYLDKRKIYPYWASTSSNGAREQIDPDGICRCEGEDGGFAEGTDDLCKF